MIVGFNHNITYRGVCFHVQTEDSGIRTPHLITLLYHGGTIICSQKTSYADILNVDNLDNVIEDLAKEQHKGMLRRLKKGEFDQRIVDLGIDIKATVDPAAEVTNEAPVEQSAKMIAAEEEAPAVEAAAPDLGAELESEVGFPEPDAAPAVAEVEEVATGTVESGPVSTDLDDLIFSYLAGDEKDS